MTKMTITNPREISIKSQYIRETKSLDELDIWKRAIRENGGERFPGETELVLETEARLSIEKVR